MNRKGFAPIIILLIVAAMLIAGGVLYYETHKSNNIPIELFTGPGTPQLTNTVSINTISPSSIPAQGANLVNTKITITGSGFTPQNNMVNLKNDMVNSGGKPSRAVMNVNSADGATLSFSLFADMMECAMTMSIPGSTFCSGKPGIYNIYVTNSNGQSNTVTFRITPVSGPGAHCGGNTNNPPVCAPGYHCAPVPNSNAPFGDVGGVCVSSPD